MGMNLPVMATLNEDGVEVAPETNCYIDVAGVFMTRTWRRWPGRGDGAAGRAAADRSGGIITAGIQGTRVREIAAATGVPARTVRAVRRRYRGQAQSSRTACWP